MIDSSPKVRASSATIGATSGPIVGSRTRFRSSRAKAIVVDTDWLPDPASRSAIDLGVGEGRGAPPDHPRRDRSVQHRAPGHQVLVGLGALGRPVVRGQVGLEERVGDLLGQVEPVPQREQLGLGHLLDLVGGVARLDLGAERPALDRLGQDDRGRAALLGGQLVGGVELAVVVAAARQRPQLVVAQVLDQPAEPGVGTEEVLADVGPRLGRVLLELAVDGGVHPVEQHPVDVAGQQLVPARAPDDLDDVPSGAPEDRLELLDDLAVAPHRTVEPLQVAVDDEDQVVEVLTPGHPECADRLGLVHLAVARRSTRPGSRSCRPARAGGGSG